MRAATLVLAPLLALAASCGGAADATVADGTVLDGTYPARCGCAIDSIGACGNYVLVDGKPVALHGDLGLGPMEFCQQDGREVTLKGTVVGGAVEPTSFALAN